MLGLSFVKLLLLAALVGLAWYVVRAWRPGQVTRGGVPPRPTTSAPSAPSTKAEDLVRCAVCGTYVAANGARACGRNDCPRGR